MCRGIGRWHHALRGTRRNSVIVVRFRDFPWLFQAFEDSLLSFTIILPYTSNTKREIGFCADHGKPATIAKLVTAGPTAWDGYGFEKVDELATNRSVDRPVVSPLGASGHLVPAARRLRHAIGLP